jgi:hypothetical protein
MNVSSVEFQTIAKRTLRKLQEHCILTHFYEQGNPQGNVFPKEFVFPADAEAHFKEIHDAIKVFRGNPIHQYAGYPGPWIENIWISHFEQKPLAFFRGLIPIFMNWIDTEIGAELPKVIQALKPVLRKDCIYITVTQGDAGLHQAAALFPNILALSAGGFGHIALPLIKGEQPLVELPESAIEEIGQHEDKKYFEMDLAFFGTDRKERHRLLMRVKEESEKNNLTFNIGYGKDWAERMAHTKVNLAPRGYGRSSFRFAECIHMGRIPFYLYDDYLWLPYSFTKKSVDHFAFVAKFDEIPAVVAKIAALTPIEYAAMLQRLKNIRVDYTYAGVMHQIELFLADPLGKQGGELRCQQHPRSFFCCG